MLRQFRKIGSSYKFLVLFLATIAVLIVSACHSNTSQLKQNQTNLTATQSSIETQVVSHALGEIQIPVSPQRIVILHDMILGAALELGVKPVGIAYYDYGGKYFRGIPPEWIAGVPVVGGVSQPSIEAILTLKPDLILGLEWQEDLGYKQLSAIAPTVLIKQSRDYHFMPRYIAQILGKRDRAEELLTEYQEKVRKLRQQLGEKLEKITISVIDVDGQNFYTLASDLLHNQILNEIGLRRPPIQQNQKDFLMSSIETLPEHDADVLFVRNAWQGSSDKFRSFLKQPIASQLQAVRNNRVYEVYWQGPPYLVADRIIDDLYKYLVD
ncbi:iron-siderophore ABC transporter substrate-binding protein [Gloeocapsopsis crepidinum]|uniref:iron-siderophore ABC transporter substrate-binding protein n=1 Tax=Gloeocapsopsis crepidinum TaxID=693223 RepID=UPI001D1401BA|nr:iron-siderophore ABC transporter substrate-binding protein [Gloeocapsopsis crepidinum]